MNNPRIWPAPAKLNLFLHVTGRRPDGYHLLQTVFQFIDWQDDLEFTVTGDGIVDRVHDVGGVDAAQDLTLRAARLLQQAGGISRGVRIRLTKRLPIGGGIGGGSSDAATTLLALNHLWGVGMSCQELARLGLALGADVPVFVAGHAAWAEGVGEELTPIELPEPWYVVIAPQATVLTREVFRALDLTGLPPPITIRDFRAGLGRNDLAPIVRRRHPEVERAWQWLSRYGMVRMTGSGACVFLEVADEGLGRQIVTECPPQFRCALARGLNRHPVHAVLG